MSYAKLLARRLTMHQTSTKSLESKNSLSDFERTFSSTDSSPKTLKMSDFDQEDIIYRTDPHVDNRRTQSQEKLDTYEAFFKDQNRRKSTIQEADSQEMKMVTGRTTFRDGKTPIDMVLAFTESQTEEYDDHLDGDNHEDGKYRQTKSEKRQIFEENLKKQGLLLELEDAESYGDKKTYFMKISAPWNLLAKYGEILNLKMPIKEEEEIEDSSCCGITEKLSSPFDYDHDMIPPEPNFFTAGFMMDREDRYIMKDREEFFSPAQRSLIVWQILLRTHYDDANSDRRGIQRLLSNGTYKAAYPLHDGKYDKDSPDGQKCDRRILYLQWAAPSNWYKKQPLWLIKRYFGDKIGLYFAWLGFYTVMLIPAAIAGILAFLYGAITLFSDDNYPSQEICDENRFGNYTMCPQCDTYCPFWQLKQSCVLSKFTYLFDNTATVFFAIFMSFWATMFLEFWKRQQAVIAWEWDLTNFEEVEQTRPEYEAKVKTTRINPVTKKPEPYLPPWNKIARVVLTSSFVLVMLCVVVIAVVGVMVYRIAIATVFFQFTKNTNEALHSNAKLLTSLSAAFLNLILIVVLNKIYQYIALWLTNIERPRTQTDFEDSYTFKMFLFQCINYYSSLFYIAFFKGKFYTYPSDERTRKNIFTRFSNDICDPAGCFYELCIQLLIIMFGKQIFNNFIELLLPKMKAWWKRHIYRNSAVENDDELSKRVFTRWEQDYNLTAVERLGLLDEYLEMVIQYGFITLFVAAFPLAPFLALINNIIEIRLDAYKFVTTLRRPLAQRAQDIGAWFGILQAVTYISVATNAITISLASDFIPHLVYRYEYSPNASLSGYFNFSLTRFNVSDWGDPMNEDWPGFEEVRENPPEFCYFKANRDPASSEYKLSESWYHIIAARCAFVLVFEHFVLGLTGLVAVLIPDVPNNVKVQILREKLLAREILFDSDEGLQNDQNDNGKAESGLRHRNGSALSNKNHAYISDLDDDPNPYHHAIDRLRRDSHHEQMYLEDS